MKIEKLEDKIVFMDNTFTKRVLINEDRVLGFVLNFKSGQGVPPHNHEESDLIVHILSGKGELTVDGRAQNVVQGDIIYCTGKELFSLKNNTETDMSCFVILAPNPSPVYSKEI